MDSGELLQPNQLKGRCANCWEVVIPGVRDLADVERTPPDQVRLSVPWSSTWLTQPWNS